MKEFLSLPRRSLCVVLPLLSHPSKTIKAPRRRDILIVVWPLTFADLNSLDYTNLHVIPLANQIFPPFVPSRRRIHTAGHLRDKNAKRACFLHSYWLEWNFYSNQANLSHSSWEKIKRIENLGCGSKLFHLQQLLPSPCRFHTLDCTGFTSWLLEPWVFQFVLILI